MTGYLIGSTDDFARVFVAAAVAILVGIAGYAFPARKARARSGAGGKANWRRHNNAG